MKTNKHTHTNTVKGQYISIHYVEQHITTRASTSAAEVNALHRAAGKLAWIPVRERQSLQHLFREINDDTSPVAAQLPPALTADSVASWSGATYSSKLPVFSQQMLIYGRKMIISMFIITPAIHNGESATSLRMQWVTNVASPDAIKSSTLCC